MECATAGLNGSFWRTDFYILKQISHVFAIFMCRPWGVHLSVSYLFAFSYGSWGSQGKNTKVVCHSLLQETTFCQNSPLWLVHLGWPHTAWLIVSLSWTRLWSMWSDWLVFCDYVSVCRPPDALLQHLLFYLGFSYLGRGVSLPSCSSKAQPLLLTLDEVTPPDLERGVAPLSPSAPTQPQWSRSRCFSGILLFSYVPADVGNLISGPSAFSKSSLNIWKFSVHILLKPHLENFECFFSRMWNECKVW